MDQVETVDAPKTNKVVALGARAVNFVRDARAELAKVTWPTRQELTDATRRVIIMTLAIGVVLGILDRVLGWILVDGLAAVAR